MRIRHPEACRLLLTNEEDPEGEPYVLLAHCLDNDRESHMMGPGDMGGGMHGVACYASPLEGHTSCHVRGGCFLRLWLGVSCRGIQSVHRSLQ